METSLRCAALVRPGVELYCVPGFVFHHSPPCAGSYNQKSVTIIIGRDSRKSRRTAVTECEMLARHSVPDIVP